MVNQLTDKEGQWIEDVLKSRTSIDAKTIVISKPDLERLKLNAEKVTAGSVETFGGVPLKESNLLGEGQWYVEDRDGNYWLYGKVKIENNWWRRKYLSLFIDNE